MLGKNSQCEQTPLYGRRKRKMVEMKGKEQEKKRIEEMRIETHSRTSMVLKERKREEELTSVSKKYETGTKRIVRSIEKEDKVQIETESKKTFGMVYSVPVVYVPIKLKATHGSPLG